MKNIFIILIIFFVANGCKEEPIGQIPVDNIAPGPVSNVHIENSPGGAILTYSLPDDEDLLYVKASYSIKPGVNSEARTSLYNDTLKVVGYGDTLTHEVTLTAVDRSQNESSPVKVMIKPKTPDVLTIGSSLTLTEDFGGIHAYWTNNNKADIAVTILKQDSNMEYVPYETFYSSVAKGDGAIRGMDTIPSNFGVYVMDRWENKSEIKYYKLKPLYETQFDRTKFREVDLPGDTGDAWGWKMPQLWDGIVRDGNGFHTANGTGIWPQWITFDMGIVGKISRIVIFQRPGSWIYSHGNPKKFELWGCVTFDPTGSWNGWTKLMDCTMIKPSGLPVNQNTNEDRAAANAGHEFLNSPLNPKVRYLRFKVTETWGETDFFHLSEIQVFGDNRGN